MTKVRRWLFLGGMLCAGSAIVAAYPNLLGVSLLHADQPLVATTATAPEPAPAPAPADSKSTSIASAPESASKKGDSTSKRERARDKQQETRVVAFGHVDVEGGTIPLAFLTFGKVREIAVQEGQKVRAGQVLARLHADIAQAQLEQAQAAVHQAKVQLAQAQRGVAIHESRGQLLDQAVAAAQLQVDTQTRLVERARKLAEADTVTPENHLAAQDLLRGYEIQLKSEQLKRVQLSLDNPRQAIELAEAALNMARAKEKQTLEQLSLHTLTAPSAGIVLRVMVAPGHALAPNSGRAAIWFCPDLPRIVRAEVNQEFAHRVAVGMSVLLYNDRIGGPAWKGTVQRCGEWIAPRRSLLDEPFERNDVRTLECIVQLENDQPSLRVGQRMRLFMDSKKGQPPSGE